jgi:hypothetical protein
MSVYRSINVAATIDAARSEVEQHRLDPATARCRTCGRSSPCEAANTAVNYLFGAGARPGVTNIAEPDGPLLTHCWRLLFGLDRPGPSLVRRVGRSR